jgi:hypothetical protein
LSSHLMAWSAMPWERWNSDPSALVSGVSMAVVFSYNKGWNWLVSPPRNPQKYSNPQIPVGQLSNGPAGEASSMGVLCHLPKAAVAYPLSVKILAMEGVL